MTPLHSLLYGGADLLEDTEGARSTQDLINKCYTLLVSRGAHTDARSAAGWTPLMLAICAAPELYSPKEELIARAKARHALPRTLHCQHSQLTLGRMFSTLSIKSIARRSTRISWVSLRSRWGRSCHQQ